MEQQTFHEEAKRAFFNHAAGNWDEIFLKEELERRLEMFVSQFDLKRGEKILDVGAGTGVLIPHILKTTGSSSIVVAVDFAERMARICNRKCHGLANVMVGVQTVERLALLPTSFDVVTCFGLFPHIKDKKKALKEINCVLRQGGKLVIAHALSSVEIRKHHQNAPQVVANDVLPEKKEMRKLLCGAGFSVRQLKDECGCYLCVALKIRDKRDETQYPLVLKQQHF